MKKTMKTAVLAIIMAAATIAIIMAAAGMPGAALVPDPAGLAVQGAMEPVSTQNVSLTTTTARTTTDFSQKIIRVICTAECSIKLGGSSVTAATTDTYLAANMPEYFVVGTNTRIAGILAAGTGTMNITEMR